MSVDSIKLAAYYSNAGESILDVATTLKLCNLNYVVLDLDYMNRFMIDHKTIHKSLQDNNISVVAISSKHRDDLSLLCAYYGVQYLIINSIGDDFDKYCEHLLSLQITPVVDICSLPIIAVNKALEFVNKFNYVRLLYDPAKFIELRYRDHFHKFWHTLNSNVSCICLSDYKYNVGPRVVGFGESDIRAIASDAVNNDYSGWFFIKNQFGAKYGDATSRSATFKLVFDGVNKLLTGVGNV